MPNWSAVVRKSHNHTSLTVKQKKHKGNIHVPFLKSLNCSCGEIKRIEYDIYFDDVNGNKYAWKCPKCNRKIYGRSKRDLIKKWNKSIEG